MYKLKLNFLENCRLNHFLHVEYEPGVCSIEAKVSINSCQHQRPAIIRLYGDVFQLEIEFLICYEPNPRAGGMCMIGPGYCKTRLPIYHMSDTEEKER